MKNFLYKKDYAPVCPIFRKNFNVFTTPQPYSNVSKKLHLNSFVVLPSFMIFVFSLRHRQILYRNKIKSPE
jgi:hypothetical protein